MCLVMFVPDCDSDIGMSRGAIYAMSAYWGVVLSLSLWRSTETQSLSTMY
jgi:hypothetical protein